MDVGVDKPGQDRPPGQVQHFGGGTQEGGDLLLRADGHNPALPQGQGLSAVGGSSHGNDLGPENYYFSFHLPFSWDLSGFIRPGRPILARLYYKTVHKTYHCPESQAGLFFPVIGAQDAPKRPKVPPFKGR